MINTIALKECRQAVRSRLVTGMLLFLVVAEMAACLITLIVHAAQGSGASMQAGRTLFTILLVVLTYGASIFVPVYTMLRLMAERWNDSVDLLYVTGMSPWAIVRGKMYSAGMILIMLFSAVMPFMALTYPLRGIDIFSMLVVLVLLAASIMLFTLFMLYVAATGTTRTHKVMNALGGIFIALFVAGSLTMFGVAALDEGLASALADEVSLIHVMMEGLMVLALAAFMYAGAATQLMPASANRALPIRLVLTGVIVVFEAVAVGAGLITKDFEVMCMPAVVNVMLVCIGLLYACVSPRALSLRVRRAIPQSRFGQLVYPWYEGAGAGFLWAMFLMMVIVGCTLAGLVIKNREPVIHFISRIVIIYVYAASAVLLARSVWMYALPRRVPARFVPLIAILIVMLGTALPLLAGLWHGFDTLPSYGRWWYGSLVAVFDEDLTTPTVAQQGIGAGWGLVVALAISLPWWWREVRAFRPLERPPSSGTACAA